MKANEILDFGRAVAMLSMYEMTIVSILERCESGLVTAGRALSILRRIQPMRRDLQVALDGWLEGTRTR